MKREIKVWVPLTRDGSIFVSVTTDQEAAYHTYQDAVRRFGEPVGRATLTLDPPKPKKKGKKR